MERGEHNYNGQEEGFKRKQHCMIKGEKLKYKVSNRDSRVT